METIKPFGDVSSIQNVVNRQYNEAKLAIIRRTAYSNCQKYREYKLDEVRPCSQGSYQFKVIGRSRVSSASRLKRF